ncbi:MAG: DUF3486 family protein [Magnetococcales bacterium]|nr:DUF3486 family protein [Magnetococcales bacterium]
MGRRSAVVGLPVTVRKWLDAALIEGNFTGYAALERELEARGCTVSRSALHRYGQEFERRLAALKLSTEQARAVVEALPDEENNLSEALVRLVQQKAFGMLLKIEEDPKTSFGTLGKIAVEAAGASTNLKKYRTEIRTRATQAAQEVASEAKAAGLSEQAVEEIRKKILGISA